MTTARYEPPFEPGDYVYSADGDEGEVVTCSFAGRSKGIVRWNFYVEWRDAGLSYGGSPDEMVRVVRRKDRT